MTRPLRPIFAIRITNFGKRDPICARQRAHGFVSRAHLIFRDRGRQVERIGNLHAVLRPLPCRVTAQGLSDIGEAVEPNWLFGARHDAGKIPSRLKDAQRGPLI